MYIINSIKKEIHLKNCSNDKNIKIERYNNKRKSNIKRYNE